MDMNAMREGLAKNLALIDGMQTASGYVLSNPTPPTAHVIPGDTLFHQASQDGDEQYLFIVQVFVALGTDIGAQTTLGEYLGSTGPRSIKRALETKQPGSHLPANMPEGVYAVVVLGHEGQQEFVPAANSNIVLLGSTFAVTVRAAPET